MGIAYNTSIVRDGLSFCIDAANKKSYPGTGTLWKDISGNNNNSTLSGAVYNTNGYMTYAGTGERDALPAGELNTLPEAVFNTSPSLKPLGVTYNVWMRFTGNQPTGHGIFFGRTTIDHIEFRGDVDSGYWRTEAALQNGYSFGGGSSTVYGGHELGKWFNLVLVFANNIVSRPVYWYMNGELFHTGNMTSGNNPDTEHFSPEAFGRSTGTDAFLYVESFKGDMGYLSCYEKSLSSDEVRQNFQALRGRYGV